MRRIAIVADEKKVQIGEAKGRPMLHWVGKRPLDYVTAYPAQLVETFNPTGEESDAQGLLFHGDNKDVLAWLLANGYRGRIDLVYIDPPFGSGADYIRKVALRGIEDFPKLEGEAYTLGEQIQYTDIWTNDTYLQFMYERLMLLRELMKENGLIFLHCDWRRVHHLRCLLDEIFGSENFINEIVWQHQIMGGSHDKRFPKAHETILWYSNGPDYRLRSEDPNVRVPFSDYVLQSMKKDDKGWYYERRRMSRKATAEEAASKAHTRTYVESPDAGTVATDVWTDMLSYQEVLPKRHGLDLYPTQKTTQLLTRLISAASDPGDLVLDCFVGSGTTATVAQELGRGWIAADINKGAVQTTSKRLQAIIQEQIEARNAPGQPTLDLDAAEDETPALATLSFSVYRVNDYDLQIQHDEVANLAVELIGIERVKTDVFFDGTLGKRLVKIIPFAHPLTLMDLQLVKDELEARPEEERDVVVVCLGKELAIDTWLEDYNKHRPINRIEIIELRTDQKYGKFFVHQPAEAQVDIRRRDGKLVIDIEDFISPTIAERLEMDAPLFRAKIPDWRTMVDVVMIDTNYDGEVFDIDMSDVPERKDALVIGHYELEAPEERTTVAVKIIDMLGEEVLATMEV